MRLDSRTLSTANRFGGVRRSLLTLFTIMAVAACGGGNTGGTDNEAPPSDVGLQTTSNGVGVGEIIPEADKRVIETAEVRPYRASSEYAPVLSECALVEFVDDVCTLTKLPYIGQTTDFITVEQVMQRVLVTHDWMGARLEQMLYAMPGDMLQMFAPVTTVIIGSEVRPSSFFPPVGLMQLDPDYLWLSVDEKRTVALAEDFRSDFGSNLQFIGLTRTMIGDQYASFYWPLEDDSERTLEHIEIPLARLLYHELAHANDYVPRQYLDTLPGFITPLDAIDQLEDVRVSTLLVNDASLTTPDTFFEELGGVRFRNEDPGVQHANVLADSVGSRMSTAGKIQFYSYSTSREDLATLLEAAMMKHHYNVDMHVAFANKPVDPDNAMCNDYKVGWGVKNRLAADLVIPRARFVVDTIMQPSAALDNFFATGVEQEIPMRQGVGWCDSRFNDASIASVGGRVPTGVLNDPADNRGWTIKRQIKQQMTRQSH